MGKFKSKTTLKIVSATSVTIFSLLTVFVATWAWFAMNQNVDGNGMNIQVSRMNGKLSYVYFHSFSGSEERVVGQTADNEDIKEIFFKFNKSPFATYEYDWDAQEIDDDNSVVDNTKWNMGEYDPFNKDHPMLILFEFDKDYTSMTPGDSYIKGTTTVEDFLGKRESNGAPHYTLPQTQVNDSDHPGSLLMSKTADTDYYALSSVAGFRHRTFSNTQYTTFLTSNTGTTLDFSTNSFTRGEAFTTIDNATETYTYNNTPNVYSSDGSSTVKYIALIVEYSADAIGYIYSTYLGDSGLNRYNSVLNFSCDWYFEVF